ncbi:glycosyl hydrolase family 28-related protein [Paenibacillus flagellatus]|uniref:Rhamnogalacturonase A/B/Epimerase-like pectate lyase domain-containing protein n=1 Tax=Paenibacillus flagellatus TaxID=2211139 RepID=A0A2V5KXL6_9BACL|nr:glycosyl hydrolase family 28-related protein [Paenibacillus flagellatus]PYI57207.1 hypothetical protein DLM86_01835 [Paenibacillus flagellatus]
MNSNDKKISRRKVIAKMSAAGMALLGAPLLAGASNLPTATQASARGGFDGIVNVLDYGAKGDGSSDDTIAIQTALNSGAGSVLIPVGDYKITSTIVIPEKVTLRGIGRFSRIIKYFDGDMIRMHDQAKILEIELDGRGKFFGGRGVIIDSGSNQKILDSSIVNTRSYCVEYVHSGDGKISTIDKCLMYTLTLFELPAIKFPDMEANGDRKIISVDCGGGLLANFAGCSTVLVVNCNMIGVIFTPNSKKVSLIGNRIAGGTVGINVEIYGINHTVIGNIVATPIIVKADSGGSVIMGNVAKVIDESHGKNKIDVDTPGLTLINNYGGTHPDSSAIVMGGGGQSPNAASISFGDGTGWRLNIGTRINDQFVPKFGFYDKGGLYFEPMNINHVSNGCVFTDSADRKLKFKDDRGQVHELSGTAIRFQGSSTATDLLSLRNDLNSLLEKLKASGLMNKR